MSIAEIVSLVALLLVSGGASSVLVQLVKRAEWGSRAKFILAIVLSGAVGLATTWLAGDVAGLIGAWGELTAAHVFAVMGATYAAATGFYELWFKGAIAKRAGEPAGK